MYRTEPALYAIDHDWQGFQWVDFHDAANSILAFLRNTHEPHEQILCVCNFTPVPRYEYRIGVPRDGYYCELLNTDASVYGGGNVGNGGGVHAQQIPSHGFPFSLPLTLPPLAVMFLKSRR
jgi:1,4-alpha-glucan branching enzyme